MALEDLTGTNKYITNLVNTNPLSADDRREGDDHIRGIKNVLLNTFPGISAPVDLAELPTYVKKAGDFMTGGLNISPASGNAILQLTKPAGVGVEASLYFRAGVQPRFRLMLDSVAETGGNAGSNIVAQSFADGGTFLNTPFVISRATGEMNIPKLTGASAAFTGEVSAGAAVRSGLSNGGGPALWGHTPSNRNMISMSGLFDGTWSITWDRTSGMWTWAGSNGGALIQFDGAGVAYKSSGAGSWNALVSDARAKRDIEDYVDGLRAVLGLRPRSFRYVLEAQMGDAVQLGFIEQESRGILPSLPASAAMAAQLGIADLKTVDQTPLAYMLVNAIKELNERIENLEALAGGVGDATV